MNEKNAIRRSLVLYITIVQHNQPSPAASVLLSAVKDREEGRENRFLLYDALCEHGLRHLHEARDVGTLDIVDMTVRLFAILHTLLVNRAHDVMELLVDLLRTP